MAIDMHRICRVCGDIADHERILYRAVSKDGEAYPVVRWFCSECDPMVESKEDQKQSDDKC